MRHEYGIIVGVENDWSIGWLDYIERELIASGGLAELVAAGVSGVTSNPTIFEAAIANGDHYDAAIGQITGRAPDVSPELLATSLILDDIRAAADVLKDVYDVSGRDDGYVSVEVQPALAHDAEGTVEAAQRLWRELGRENVMIKVPGTVAGVEALERLLAGGININVTLLFSRERYQAVANAYIKGIGAAPEPSRVRSVASFFVSRVDAKIDPLLDRIGTPAALEHRGQAAIANAVLAYQQFRDIFDGPAFETQRQRGARPQKLLWASTSTKDPHYSDVLYVDSLIGRDTINTMAPATLRAWQDHGVPAEALCRQAAQAAGIWSQIRELGVDVDGAATELEDEGIEAFAKSYRKLLDRLETKLGVHQ